MHAPGLGNPLRLRIDEFDEALEFIIERLRDESAAASGDTHRAFVEREMRKL